MKMQGNGGHHRQRPSRQCECGSRRWSPRHAIMETLRDIAITITRLDL